MSEGVKEARITHGSMRDWFQSENEVRSRENGVSETFETRDKTRAQHDAGDTIAREAPCFIYRDLAHSGTSHACTVCFGPSEIKKKKDPYLGCPPTVSNIMRIY